MKNVVIVFFSFIQIFSHAQSPEQNHEKYWYYRYKLLNNFIKVGDKQGESIPASTRGDYDFSSLYWGDATIDLGWYISVLATEYKLLVKNNQDASATVRELYYALEAFNRLDYNAEIYLSNGSQGGSLNGFFVRDDIPSNFIGNPTDPASNYYHFNSGFIENHCHPQFSQTQNCEVVNIDSDYTRHLGESNPESLDQVAHLLMGLALVNSCLDESTSFNGLNFMDGESRILYEARNITDRVIDWIRIHSWFVRNPVTGNNLSIDDGGAAQLFSYGYAEAACKATNKTDFTHLATGLTCFDYHDEITFPGGLAIWEAYNNPVVFFAIVNTSSYNDHLIGLLAAIGNSWYDPYPPFLPINNTTNQSLSAYFTSPQYSRPYLSLLRQVLHGGGNLVSNGTYIDLLDAAPCAGPRNVDGNYADFEWSTTNRFKNPEHRGDLLPAHKGEYNGMDYMLLFNLYALAKDESNSPYISTYFNLMEKYVSLDLPAFFPFIGEVGSHANPTEIDAFREIIIDSHLGADADATFRAGEQVGLGPNFGVDVGADWGMFVQPFVCSTGPYGNYIRSSGDTSAFTSSYSAPVNYVYHSNANSSNGQQATSAESYLSKTPFVNLQSLMRVTPNPTSGLFTLHLDGNINGQILIYNNLGELVYRDVINLEQQIDLSSQPKGIYAVKVQSAERVYTEKVIIW